MRDDFDSVVADRFKVLDDVPVPDTWSRVQFKVLDRMPVQFTEEDATMIDLETSVPTDDRQQGAEAGPGRRAPGRRRCRCRGGVRGSCRAMTRRSSLRRTPRSARRPSLVVRPLDPPIECDLSVPVVTGADGASVGAPDRQHRLDRAALALAVSPDGTLVALDPAAGTLTWYEEEPRVVPLAPASFGSSVDETPSHARSGRTTSPTSRSGVARGLRRRRSLRCGDHASGHIPGGAPAVYPAATGLVRTRSDRGAPNAAPWMPWVDLDGNPITDTRPYPTATATDAGIEVRLGEREWLLTDEPGVRPRPLDFLARSDGGVVMRARQWRFATDTARGQARNLLELSPDGTIERYFVDTPGPTDVLPDGSLIVEHDLQLVRLTPPG